jgi:RNA polymerase sigma-70 factor (ECF subfamily)
MPPGLPAGDPAARRLRFTRIYEMSYRRLLGYVVRRVDQPVDAADILADVFLVAWRRMDEIPDDSDCLYWLYGVARRSIANHRRGARRREAATDRLRSQFVAMIALVDAPQETAHPALLTALARLSDEDREVLTLTSWDELSTAEVARVLDVKPGTARVRLHRARARLRSELQTDPELDSQRRPEHERTVRLTIRKEA